MATKYYYSQASGDNDGSSEANAYTDLQTALDALSAGDHLYCKRHTSREGAITTNLSFATHSNAAAGPNIIEGYSTTPGDGGSGDGFYQTKSPFDMTAAGTILKYWDIDKENDSTTGLRIRGDASLAYRCIIQSSYAFGACLEIQDAAAIECYAISTVTQSGDTVFRCNRATLIGCVAEIHPDAGAAGSAFSLSVAHRQNVLMNCIAINSDSDGAASHVGMFLDSDNASASTIMNCTITNFAKGIEHVDGDDTVTTPNLYYGNILYSCGDGIINSQGTYTDTYGQYVFNNAFGSITSNQVSNMSNNQDPVTLTETPFVDTVNFELNNAPGGGALCRGTFGSPVLGLTGDNIRRSFLSHGGRVPTPNPEQSSVF